MPDTHTRPFADFLVKQRGGALNAEAATALADLVQSVAETGKDGTLTLTVKVARNKAGALEITDKVATKLPSFDRVPTLWWADDDGNLSRRDPNQPTFDDALKVVDGDEPDEAEPKPAATAAGGNK